MQGVGFRPFVWRLARSLDIAGTVQNTPAGVVVNLQADSRTIDTFVRRLRLEHPAAAQIDRIERADNVESSASVEGFRIISSSHDAEPTTQISPDLALCNACRADLFDKRQPRRLGYALVNCTNCGPRYSIVRAIPYDRANTTMAGFELCDACRAEYESPADRLPPLRPEAEPVEQRR